MHIIGASGHAKVIVDILLELGVEISGIWDENSRIEALMGYPIKGNFEAFKKIQVENVIIAIGNNTIRKRISLELAGNSSVAIHPKAVISRFSSVGVGTVIMANATVNVSALIGKHSIINTNSSVDHDCILEDYVHISPQAGLAGNVFVGEGTHIGIGASVIQGVKIGKWANVGAGAVVIRDVPDYAVVVGNPGKVIRYNTPA
ncbi:acetyltransferase [Pedobacter psychroterrae]|uniref:Acetyltransferase n=1 Tax=Pedobacter psychroterrae TaxID=2530453 RepID=A0A4R0NP44_9SPHI|nr:acetyltransferase [Pedobacter psychroterrae]TCD02691.1 acetyltransferase [Pedobacter psychroterrae]